MWMPEYVRLQQATGLALPPQHVLKSALQNGLYNALMDPATNPHAGSTEHFAPPEVLFQAPPEQYLAQFIYFQN